MLLNNFSCLSLSLSLFLTLSKQHPLTHPVVDTLTRTHMCSLSHFLTVETRAAGLSICICLLGNKEGISSTKRKLNFKKFRLHPLQKNFFSNFFFSNLKKSFSFCCICCVCALVTLRREIQNLFDAGWKHLDLSDLSSLPRTVTILRIWVKSLRSKHRLQWQLFFSFL